MRLLFKILFKTFIQLGIKNISFTITMMENKKLEVQGEVAQFLPLKLLK